MTGEILSLETAEKLKRIEKAIEYIENEGYYSKNISEFEKVCNELLKILKGE